MAARVESRAPRHLLRGVAGGGSLVLPFILLAACGGSEPHLTVRDRDGRVADAGLIEVFRGEEHCGWQGVIFLRLGSLSGEELARDARMYIRDPDEVLTDQTVARYSGSATLPSDARFTGYTSDAGAFWFARDQDTVAYVVSDEDGEHVEVWPRTKTILGCD